MKYYKRNDDGTASECDEKESDRLWSDDRVICRDRVGSYDDKPVWVSTIFLMFDHGLSCGLVEGMPPLLWETMTFGGPLDLEVERYASEAAAKEGHARMIEKNKKALGI